MTTLRYKKPETASSHFGLHSNVNTREYIINRVESIYTRYISEYVGRFNLRDLGMLEQMASVVLGMENKKLCYHELTA